MSTTNEVQEEIGSYLPTWFTNAGIAMEPAQIKDYLTTPDYESSHPNWCILGVTATTTRTAVLGDSEEPAQFVLILFARLGKGDQAEASREAAERWLNDAEEMVVRNLENLPSNLLWYGVDVRQPRRDVIREWHGKYRTSIVPFVVEKR